MFPIDPSAALTPFLMFLTGSLCFLVQGAAVRLLFSIGLAALSLLFALTEATVISAAPTFGSLGTTKGLMQAGRSRYGSGILFARNHATIVALSFWRILRI